MAGLPYYKRYPRDFIDGTIGLPLELKGPYSIILDLIYLHGGELIDDARYISSMLGCPQRRWYPIRDALVSKNKLELSGGYVRNKRASNELIALGCFQDKQSINASGHRKNKDLQKPKENHTDTDTDTDTDITPLLPSGESDPVPIAFDAYNQMAVKAGLSQAQKLTDDRRKKIKARLKDCGGLAGWDAAMGKVAASANLCGDNRNNFRADLDFILRPQWFTKILEGGYDNFKPRQVTGQSKRDASLASLDRAIGGGGGTRAVDDGHAGPTLDLEPLQRKFG